MVKTERMHKKNHIFSSHLHLFMYFNQSCFSGDFFGALAFPLLTSYIFYTGFLGRCESEISLKKHKSTEKRSAILKSYQVCSFIIDKVIGNSFSFYSALFGFFLMLVTVKLKGSLPQEHCGVWFFLAKVRKLSPKDWCADFVVKSFHSIKIITLDCQQPCLREQIKDHKLCSV